MFRITTYVIEVKRYKGSLNKKFYTIQRTIVWFLFVPIFIKDSHLDSL